MALNTDLNFLLPTAFRFSIARLPVMDNFVQSFRFPRVTLGDMQQVQTPFSRLTVAGDHLSYGEIEVGFRLDEQMLAYTQIYDWMVSAAFPDNFSQYNPGTGPTTKDKLVSEGTLIVLSGTLNPTIAFKFHDLIPSDLSPLEFTSSSQDLEYVSATATFKFRDYSYEPII